MRQNYSKKLSIILSVSCKKITNFSWTTSLKIRSRGMFLFLLSGNLSQQELCILHKVLFLATKAKAHILATQNIVHTFFTETKQISNNLL